MPEYTQTSPHKNTPFLIKYIDVLRTITCESTYKPWYYSVTINHFVYVVNIFYMYLLFYIGSPPILHLTICAYMHRMVLNTDSMCIIFS